MAEEEEGYEPAAAEPEELPDGELKKYLDEGGVLEAWAKCLVALHQEAEKPDNPVGFVEEFFGGKKNAEIADLQAKIVGLEASLAAQAEEIAALKEAKESGEEYTAQ